MAKKIPRLTWGTLKLSSLNNGVKAQSCSNTVLKDALQQMQQLVTVAKVSHCKIAFNGPTELSYVVRPYSSYFTLVHFQNFCQS